MRQPKFAKDTPINEKRIDFIERCISKIARRSRKTVTSMISPQTISACVSGDDVRDDIMKYMFFKGEITKLMVLFNEKPKSPINVEVRTLSKSEGTTKNYYIEKAYETIDIDIPTIDGTMVVVSIHPTDSEQKIKESWISLLWTPHISTTDKEQLLIDDLEKSSNIVLSEGE